MPTPPCKYEDYLKSHYLVSSQVSEGWLEGLLDEYFNQSDLEKGKDLPFAPFMAREAYNLIIDSNIGSMGTNS